MRQVRETSLAESAELLSGANEMNLSERLLKGRGTGWNVWDGGVVAALWLQQAAQQGAGD